MSNNSGGKPSASVYRRRRITVAVFALIIVGLLIWGVIALAGILAPDGDESASKDAQTEQSQPSESSSTPPEDTEALAKKCKEDEIALTATTDAKNYATDKKPVLILGIENVSERDCDLNVGTTQQEFLVSSGADRIFSTVDCLDGGEDVNLTFKPGQKENARFTWNRDRSAPGCKIINVQPRPGTYKFTAAIGEFTSAPVTFYLD